MKEFWSSRIRGLTPYTPGEQPREENLIKLNTNENPYPPSPAAVQAIREEAGDRLRLYPDPEGSILKGALSRAHGVPESRIFVGNGSDEVLAFAFQAFFDPGADILFPDITYSFYPVYARMFGINFRTVPLREDFTVAAEKFTGENGGIVLANPNAPTGMELGQEALRGILDTNPGAVVLVDEAYVDFGGTSALPLVEEYPNLLVVRTCSKSRSLAGLRVGYAVGQENLIEALGCVKNSINSYTLDRLALVGAAAAVEDGEYFSACCRRVEATREKTAAALRDLGFTVCPSRANFLFVSHPGHRAEDLYRKLRENGILVRYFPLPRIDNFLRISIGREEEMERLCAVTAKLLEEN